jgi:hypothetical protein
VNPKGGVSPLEPPALNWPLVDASAQRWLADKTCSDLLAAGSAHAAVRLRASPDCSLEPRDALKVCPVPREAVDLRPFAPSRFIFASDVARSRVHLELMMHVRRPVEIVAAAVVLVVLLVGGAVATGQRDQSGSAEDRQLDGVRSARTTASAGSPRAGRFRPRSTGRSPRGRGSALRRAGRVERAPGELLKITEPELGAAVVLHGWTAVVQ